MTALLQDHPVVQQAYGQYKQFNQDERLRAVDEAHQLFLIDQASDREEAHEKGVAKVSRNMKSEGCDFAFISKMTGLSAVEIDRLS
jgi:hypothetical protein